ncbi:hypothetical protein TNIN_225921 [Trichonephila inaurata madagascariensis]|uniref:Uncharacterized protein n=1 Tax=Trichonephila inaurata madagascariensis TaxID=2747483 RepID=A0A8X6X763_9ARAC|nr:hypothetical protein TNIN_225921 [Trichonephila inaurata madagascariensis]
MKRKLRPIWLLEARQTLDARTKFSLVKVNVEVRDQEDFGRNGCRVRARVFTSLCIKTTASTTVSWKEMKLLQFWIFTYLWNWNRTKEGKAEHCVWKRYVAFL